MAWSWCSQMVSSLSSVSQNNNYYLRINVVTFKAVSETFQSEASEVLTSQNILLSALLESRLVRYTSVLEPQ